MRVLVAGGGLFALTAARELARRGHEVVVLEQGEVPHPDASSTDVSKAVRMDYGRDELYVDLAAKALAGWREFEREVGAELFHEVGFSLLTSRPMQAGEFEHDSYHFLRERGYALERFDERTIPERFPVFARGAFVDGYYNPRAGWVESSKAIEHLARSARAAGVEVRSGERVQALSWQGSEVSGVCTENGRQWRAERTLIAAGAWSASLLPELSQVLRPVAQPVFHFQLSQWQHYQPPYLSVFAADIGRLGWYGFPALDDGRLKVGHHGRGQAFDPRAARVMPPNEEARFREFLGRALPQVAAAPVATQRLCFYCDTPDGDFWIDHVPAHPRLVVAAGGSGHAFKFLPVLGPIVADVVESEKNSQYPRFAQRKPYSGHSEAARARES